MPLPSVGVCCTAGIHIKQAESPIVGRLTLLSGMPANKMALNGRIFSFSRLFKIFFSLFVHFCCKRMIGAFLDSSWSFLLHLSVVESAPMSFARKNIIAFYSSQFNQMAAAQPPGPGGKGDKKASPQTTIVTGKE